MCNLQIPYSYDSKKMRFVGMSFEKVISLCERHGFLKKLQLYKQDILKIGPVGALLQENLRSEWLYSTLTNRNLIVLLSGNSFADTFSYAKGLCVDRLPFGIVQTIEEKCDNLSQAILDVKQKKENDDKQESYVDPSGKDKKEDVCFERYFVGENNVILKNTTFVSPNNSTPMFHQWQRQRRTWWRKVCSY